MRAVVQARLGQPVSIDSRTPTQCLNAKDFARLEYENGELFVGCKSGKEFVIMSANIAILELVGTIAEPKKAK